MCIQNILNISNTSDTFCIQCKYFKTLTECVVTAECGICGGGDEGVVTAAGAGAGRGGGTSSSSIGFVYYKLDFFRSHYN